MRATVPRAAATRATTFVSSVPSSPVDVALAEVVLAAYPTATFLFFPPETARRPTMSGRNRVVHLLEAPHSLVDAAATVPCDCSQVVAAPHSWWPSLHRLCGPMTPSSVPGSYPRCRFLTTAASRWTDDAFDKELPPSRQTRRGKRPLWVPHATILIGGFESNDLREVVLPAVAEHIPTLPADRAPARQSSLSRDTGRHIQTVRDLRRMPAYMRKKNFEQNLFHEKGCAAYGTSLVELSLSIPRKGSPPPPPRRERVYATFADPNVTVAALLREADATRRATLRSAFGVSLPLLQQSLPTPVTTAAMAVCAWEKMVGVPEAGSAFWLSAMAHCLTRTAGDELHAVWRGTCTEPEKSRLLEAEQLLNAAMASDEAPSDLPSSWRTEQTQCLVARCLARALLHFVAACTNDEWEGVYLRNFFLPVEDFSSCVGVQRLAKRRAALLDSPGPLDNALSDSSLRAVLATVTADVTFG